MICGYVIIYVYILVGSSGISKQHDIRLNVINCTTRKTRFRRFNCSSMRNAFANYKLRTFRSSFFRCVSHIVLMLLSKLSTKTFLTDQKYILFVH